MANDSGCSARGGGRGWADGHSAVSLSPGRAEACGILLPGVDQQLETEGSSSARAATGPIGVPS